MLNARTAIEINPVIKSPKGTGNQPSGLIERLQGLAAETYRVSAGGTT